MKFLAILFIIYPFCAFTLDFDLKNKKEDSIFGYLANYSYNKSICDCSIHCEYYNQLSLIIEKIIKETINPNIFYLNRSLLYMVVEICSLTRQKSILELLFGIKDIEVNIRNKDNDETPLFAFYGKYGYSKQILELLINNGADINAKNQKNQTVLMKYCASYDLHDANTVEFLLNYKNIDINAKDYKGRSALILACMGTSLSIVQKINKLIQYHGIDLNIQDKYGKTALMHLAKCNDGPWDDCKYLAAVELLIFAGADTDLKDNEGKTFLRHAKDKNIRTKLCQIIEKRKQQLITENSYRTEVFVV